MTGATRKVIRDIHAKRHRALTIIAAVLGSVIAMAGPCARAAEIWMYAAPHVETPAPGWEAVRTDSGEMWRPNAPWARTSRSVRVIQFAPTNIERAKDSDLQQAFAELKRRNIALAIGDGLLIKSDRCQSNSEAYVAPGALERLLDKVRRNGGDVKYVTMDEPFFYGNRDSSATSCHETAAALAHALKDSIRIVRTFFPDARIGDDEVVDQSKPWIEELGQWADAYRAATGEPLAYLHADLDWSEGATLNLLPLSKMLKQHGVPLGIIYDADRFAKTDQSWTQNAISHYTRVEEGLGVHPDHAVFETWTRYPTHMLPESESGTLTNVVLQYIQKHPQ